MMIMTMMMMSTLERKKNNQTHTISNKINTIRNLLKFIKKLFCDKEKFAKLRIRLMIIAYINSQIKSLFRPIRAPSSVYVCVYIGCSTYYQY